MASINILIYLLTLLLRNKLQGKRKGSTNQSSSNEVDNKRYMIISVGYLHKQFVM